MTIIDQDVKTAIINVLHMFRKVEEGKTTMKRKEDIKRCIFNTYDEKLKNLK